jgi:hypothetical protein
MGGTEWGGGGGGGHVLGQGYLSTNHFINISFSDWGGALYGELGILVPTGLPPQRRQAEMNRRRRAEHETW